MRTTYVFDTEKMELVEKSKYYRDRAEVNAPAVMADIAGYKSMATGEWINSRSTHREHLKQHRLIEIGNEKMANTPRPIDRAGIRKAAENAVRRILG
jgi:hypothetical protein